MSLSNIKISTAIPVSGREPLLKLTIKRLVNQGIHVICIGHTETEKDVCVNAGASFFKVDSSWTLGQKCQYGVDLLRGSDFVMFIGSAGMVSNNWLGVVINEASKGYAMVGTAGTYILDVQHNNKKEMIYFKGHLGARSYEPLAV